MYGVLKVKVEKIEASADNRDSCIGRFESLAVICPISIHDDTIVQVLQDLLQPLLHVLPHLGEHGAPGGGEDGVTETVAD